MYRNFNFRDVLASSAKAAWQVEDVLPHDARLDFGRPFLPEALARTDCIAFLSRDERRLLTRLNIDAFERAAGRTLSAEARRELHFQQHQALRWTYLASGMVHPRFTATLAALSPAACDRVAAVAPAFA